MATTGKIFTNVAAAPAVAQLESGPSDDHQACAQRVALRALEVTDDGEPRERERDDCLSRRQRPRHPGEHCDRAGCGPQEIPRDEREQRERGEQQREGRAVLEEVGVQRRIRRVEILTGRHVRERRAEDQEIVLGRERRALHRDARGADQIQSEQPSQRSNGIRPHPSVAGGGGVAVGIHVA